MKINKYSSYSSSAFCGRNEFSMWRSKATNILYFMCNPSTKCMLDKFFAFSLQMFCLILFCFHCVCYFSHFGFILSYFAGHKDVILFRIYVYNLLFALFRISNFLSENLCYFYMQYKPNNKCSCLLSLATVLCIRSSHIKWIIHLWYFCNFCCLLVEINIQSVLAICVFSLSLTSAKLYLI